MNIKISLSYRLRKKWKISQFHEYISIPFPFLCIFVDLSETVRPIGMIRILRGMFSRWSRQKHFVDLFMFKYASYSISLQICYKCFLSIIIDGSK